MDERKMTKVATVRKEGLKLPALKLPKKLSVSKLSDIEPEEIDWLWYPYIPAGKLTLIEGDPGMGKSWITCSLAADISAGRPLPGQKITMPPQRVLMLSAEDGLGDTVRPRIEAMGGNLENIYVSDEHFILDETGLEQFEELMKTVAATIVFMDPLVAFLGGKMDMNKANETRAMMGPLADIAKRTGTSVVAVRHLRKAKGGKAIYAGIGSIDFTASVRSVMQVDESKGGTKFMFHAKHNLSPKGDAIAYSVRDGRFAWEGVFEDEGETESHAVNTKSKLQERAEQFLFDTLRDGPVAATDLMAKAGLVGLHYAALNKAKKGIAHSEKQGSGGWFWMLDERGSISAPSHPVPTVADLPAGQLPPGLLEQVRARLEASKKVQ